MAAGGKEINMSLALKAKKEVVNDYFHLFVNRRAYVVQSMRPHPESGHYYYYRPKAKATNKSICLTEGMIRRHLEGGVTVGLYAINPATQRCKWVAIDADYKDAVDTSGYSWKRPSWPVTAGSTSTTWLYAWAFQ